MDQDALTQQIEEVRGLMAERLRLRGATLEDQVRRAKRLLPRTLVREAQYLAQAETLMRNPKLARMVDAEKARGARDRLTAHLMTVDPKERRKDRILGILGGLAFNLLLIGALAVIWLRWRGVV